MSQPDATVHRMIDLGSLAGLHEQDHSLAADCRRCDTWRVLPLAEMVAEGKGLLRLPIGEVGRLRRVIPLAP
jgi:hypothetical protein